MLRSVLKRRASGLSEIDVCHIFSKKVQHVIGFCLAASLKVTTQPNVIIYLTGIWCQIGHQIPVIRQRPLLAQTGHSPDFDECPLPLHSGQPHIRRLGPSSHYNHLAPSFYAAFASTLGTITDPALAASGNFGAPNCGIGIDPALAASSIVLVENLAYRA